MNRLLSPTLPMFMNLLFIFLTGVNQNASAKVMAKESNVPECTGVSIDDPRVAGRASRVKFPDGRIITVVGHFHGDRQIYSITNLVQGDRDLRGILSDLDELSDMSDVQFSEMIKNILKENSQPPPFPVTRADYKQIQNDFKKKYPFLIDEANYDLNRGLKINNVVYNLSVFNNAKDDYSYLHSLLNVKDTPNGIQFVGWEGTEVTRSNNLPALRKNYSAVIENFFKRINKKPNNISVNLNDVKNALLSGSGANSFIYMENPELMTKIPLIGTENPVTGKNQAEMDKFFKNIESVVKELGEADDQFWARLSIAQREGYMKNKNFKRCLVASPKFFNKIKDMSFLSQAEFNTDVKFLHSCLSHTPWLKAPIEKLINLSVAHFKLESDRNRGSAETLVNRRQTGIHFVGLNHYRDTINQLEKICLNEKSGSIGRSYKVQRSLSVN